MHQKYKNKKNAVITSPCQYARGFTIVELVVVISVMAILGSMSVGFIRTTVQGYMNAQTNLSVADEADTALRRMGRDIRNALPNSVRVTTSGGNSYVEFIPVVNAGRYRAEYGASGAGNPLDFEAAGDSFDLYGTPITVNAGDQLVIYNMGITGADAYAGENRRALTAGANLSTLTFTGIKMPFASPNSRFYTVNGAVSYVCDVANKRLLRYGNYAISTAQPTTFGATPARVLASDVSACTIEYTDGLLQRTGIVTVNITLSKTNSAQGTANARLVHIINVVNAP